MSSINPNNIDGTYPIAGQDNSSQGFRDNFTNIKNNLAFAKSEIEDLQKYTLLKNPLPGTTLNNEMNNAQIKGAQLLKTTQTINNLGTISGDLTLDWEQAPFQYFEIGDNVTLNINNWPTSGLYATLRLQITASSDAVNSNYTVTFSNTGVVYNGLNEIQNVYNNVFTPATPGVYLFDFSTYNNGTTVTVTDPLRKTNVDYQYYVPSNNFSVQANTGGSRIIFDPATTLANGTLTLPAGNVDAATFSVSSSATITALQVKGFGTAAVKPSANITLTAGIGVEYFYSRSQDTWFKTK
jgi:hypothetical protein